MTEAFLETEGGEWKTIGYLNDCQACPTDVPPFSVAQARYLWRRCSASSNCCTTRLCVECCARWRADVEVGALVAPYRISEIQSGLSLETS